MSGLLRNTLRAISSVVLPAVLVAAGLPAVATARPVSGAVPTGSRYVNPVSRGFADTFPDPSIIRGRDGYWYAYGTADPLRESQMRPALLPIARSRDLVQWRFVGEVLTTRLDDPHHPVREPGAHPSDIGGTVTPVVQNHRKAGRETVVRRRPANSRKIWASEGTVREGGALRAVGHRPYVPGAGADLSLRG